MSRRTRLTARRTKFSTSSSSASSTAALNGPPLLQNNRYVPDVSKLAHDIASTLLHVASDSPLADVILKTADNVNVAVNKTLLAIRSPYFHNLFFSRFAEAGASEVPVPLRSQPLRHVLQFVYTADCALIHDALRALPSKTLPRTPPEPLDRSIIVSLVELSVAADYFHITQLQRLANDTLSALVTEFPVATCTALEAMRNNPMALKFCNPLRLWAEAIKRPRYYFLVPDCLDTSPNTKANNQSQPQPQPQIIASSYPTLSDETMPLLHTYGVLELSADTLDYLLRFATNSSDYEYLFQVIHFWATDGRCVRRRPIPIAVPPLPTPLTLSPQSMKTPKPLFSPSISPLVLNASLKKNDTTTSTSSLHPSLDGVSSTLASPNMRPLANTTPTSPTPATNPISGNTNINTSDECGAAVGDDSNATGNGVDSKLTDQWRLGMRLMSHINWSRVRPEFIRDYVEASGLVSSDILFDAYKHHAIKDSPTKVEDSVGSLISSRRCGRR